MSRVAYQFVSNSSTSWTHEYSCNLCKLVVTREGGLPAEESAELIPRWRPGQLDGWSSFNVARREDENDGHYDFCPACTSTLLDSWLERGVGAATPTTEKYLDVFGRAVEDPKALAPVWGCPIEICRMRDGHEGSCDDASEAGVWRKSLISCPRCREHFSSEHALACHAVLVHIVTELDPATSHYRRCTSPEGALRALRDAPPDKPRSGGKLLFPDPRQRNPTATLNKMVAGLQQSKRAAEGLDKIRKGFKK